MDAYQQFIHKSRYARYVDQIQRREHWEETVDRFVNFMVGHLYDNFNYEVPEKTAVAIREAIVNLEVMPSMRAVMTAGKALARDHTAGYNCSYVPVDDPKAFDEAMHILMCGTGVGFSVERQYVTKLPEVPDQLFDSDTTIVVKDSKEGWSKAFRQVIALLYSGEIPKWDLSRLRPAGARLKTFGGRSSGPEPLDELFKFTVHIFKGAVGRKLTSLEAHDLMCKIGATIVVGGVRRSAMISLSNLSDDRMRHAKAGAWWEQNVQRALSNNSACYTEKPDVGIFMEEWIALYNSKSGERGIFNREASKNVCVKYGRRDPEWEWGTNPCSEIILRPNQFCNLTEVVVRSTDTREDLLRKVKLATILGTWQSSMTNFPYLRKAWKRNTEEERLLGVSLTGIYDNDLLNNYEDRKLPLLLQELRVSAVETNEELAEELGIPSSAAITCVKPSGTVSQLVNSASGIHPRYAKYYIRRVRNDIKDPITQHLIDAGVPFEPDVTNPQNVVFSFPQKAPKESLTRDEVSALDHLKLWLMYQENWCEHKPSVTINVHEHEWPTVGAFVWENFDAISGISFLPYDSGTYRQAPYEKITEDQYNQLLAEVPSDIDWNTLVEETDQVEGVQTLACTAAGCEL